MTEQELDELLKREIPKELLTEEQFSNLGKCGTIWDVKYINQITHIGLKLSKVYLDMYVTEKNKNQ
jgi:hypothetical protein